MSLAEQLDGIRAGAATRIPEGKRAIMSAATVALRESGILDGVAKVGDQLPGFALPNADGGMVQSADLLARGPLVLTFFRGTW
jgi:hypothetical protein